MNMSLQWYAFPATQTQTKITHIFLICSRDRPSKPTKALPFLHTLHTLSNINDAGAPTMAELISFDTPQDTSNLQGRYVLITRVASGIGLASAVTMADTHNILGPTY